MLDRYLIYPGVSAAGNHLLRRSRLALRLVMIILLFLSGVTTAHQTSPFHPSFDTDPQTLTLTQAEKDWLSRNTVITLGVDGRWPPVDFLMTPANTAVCWRSIWIILNVFWEYSLR